MNSHPMSIGFTEGAAFSNGFVAGDTLYVAGQQGGGSSISEQTTNAIGNVTEVVQKAGFRMSDLTSVTVFFTDINDVPGMNAVYKDLIPDPKPARAAVQVAGLIGGARVEIAAIAVKR
jgi:2-iminobutanoate/2-iminopropanoate deaminase